MIERLPDRIRRHADEAAVWVKTHPWRFAGLSCAVGFTAGALLF